MSRDSPSLSPQGFWNGSARDSARNPSNTDGQDPPRPAKDGFEWVWFPDGYWAERPAPRRISSKNPGTISVASAGKIFRWTSRANGCPAPSHEHELRELSPKTIQATPPLRRPQLNLAEKSSGSFSPSRTLPQSPWLSEAAQVQALQRPADQQLSFVGINILNEQFPHTRKRSSGEPSAASALQGGKTSKSKSSWNLFQRSKVCEWVFLDCSANEASNLTVKNQSPVEALPAPAMDAAVDATPSYFTQKPVDPPRLPTPPEDKKEYASSWPLRNLRRWVSKAPKSRSKDTLSSPPTSRTSASSPNTHKWIAPNTPVSPAGASDGCRKHEGKNDLGTIDERRLTWRDLECCAIRSRPADEALSVATPPIKQSAGGYPKSLFMDIKHPLLTDDSASSSASSVPEAPMVFPYRKGADVEKREWWDTPKALVRRDPVKGISFFEFDMPEHLPSSPVCPANPMHKLKGKGVCVFHGRSKQAPIDDDARIAEEDSMENP